MEARGHDPLEALLDVATGHGRRPPTIYRALHEFLLRLPLEAVTYTVAELEELQGQVERELSQYVTQDTFISVNKELMRYRYAQLKALEVEQVDPLAVDMLLIARCPACGHDLTLDDPDAEALSALPPPREGEAVN
jgi:hypothetical protein